MLAQGLHRNTTQDLALLLGPLRAEIMRLLWTRGPATVRELHTWLTRDTPRAYTTIMTTCVCLTEKGLLERRRVTEADKGARAGKAYVYVPLISEEEFARAAVGQRVEGLLDHYPALIQEQVAGVPTRRPSITTRNDRARVEHILAYLDTLRDPQDQPIDETVLDTIAALLERAETAERAAATREAEVERAAQRTGAAEQRALAAERRAEKAERQLEAALQQMNRPPQPERKQRVRPGSVHEYRDVAGICRVCGRPAPPPSAARRDDLRVCTAPDCRQEARRRDNNAKQRRARERRLARAAQMAAASAVDTRSATP